jgi:hypothetical protein
MAQVKPLKLLSNGDFAQLDTASDDLTANSFSGDGSSLTSLDAGNISTGTLAKERLDSAMVDATLSYTAGVIGIELSNANTWNAKATFDISGGGELLELQADAADAEAKLFQVKNSGGTPVAFIDEDGDMTVNDLTVNGAETIVGIVTTQSALNVEGALSVSGTVTLGNEATDDINFTGRAATDLNMNSNNIVMGTGTVDGRDVSADGTALDGHLDGGSNKHDASEVDVETAGNFTTVSDLETNLSALDGAFGGDLSFVPTNYSDPADNVQAHLQAIDTALGTLGSGTDVSDLEAAVGSSTGLAGLDYSSNNYVTDATSLETAVGALDAQVYSNEVSVTGAVDAIGAANAAALSYSSTNYVTNGTSLETAVGALDAQVGTNASDITTLFSSAASHATKELDNLGTTAINASLLVDTDSSYNLGSSSAAWSNLFADAIDTTTGTDLSLKRDGSSKIDLGASSTTSYQSFEPSASGLYNLGSSTLTWDNVYVENIGNNAGTIDVDNLVDKSAAESIAGAWDFSDIDLNLNFKINGVATGSGVTSANLDTLTDGSNADALHTHAAADSTDLALSFTASGAVAAGAPVYVVSTSDNTVAEADASAIGTARLIGIAESAVSDAASGNITVAGFATIPGAQIDGGTFTRGEPVYLSETTGNLTSTAPSTSGARIYQVGIATTTTSLVIDLKQGVTVS